MISVKEAEKIIRENFPVYPPEEIPIAEAGGRELRENIISDREQPPFDRVAMDGIAIKYESWEKGIREFKIQGTQAAGKKPLKLLSPNHCLEVMTGAVLPENCDCVIKVEDLEINGQQAKIIADIQPELRQNIHQRGSDLGNGKLLIPEGKIINPALISIICSFGKAIVKVSKKPSLAIIGTGDELVEPGKPVENHQIRMSNAYALESFFRQKKFSEIKRFHLKDEKELIFNELTEILEKFDLLLLSGGVSQGKFDFIPEVLKELGVSKIFHKITQKPGKPFWFGKKENKLVFALPGNPTSTLVCFYRYVVPLLEKKKQKTFIRLGSEIKRKKGFTFFKAVFLEEKENADPVAKIIEDNGSGDFCSLAESSGFIELDGEQEYFATGSFVPYYHW